MTLFFTLQRVPANANQNSAVRRSRLMGVSLPPVAYERIHGRQRASVRGLEDDLEGGYLSKHRRHTCNSGSLPVSRSEVKRAVTDS